MSPATRLTKLAISCVVLGIGVSMLLLAALGSDGYSTFVNGAAMTLGTSFLVVNCSLGLVLIVLARWRGVGLGAGTLLQPVLVGAAVSAGLAIGDEPSGLIARGVLLLVAFPIVAVGVAGYLASGTGAGPTEAAALAFDPPVPFRWSYTAVQAGGAISGWWLGAAIGPGTLLVIVLLGPLVDLLSARFRVFDITVSAREVRTDSASKSAPAALPPQD